MRKLIIALVALGAVIALRSVAKHKAEKVREHCHEMAAKCKEKMAGAKTPSEEDSPVEPPEPATTPVGDRGEELAAA